MRRLFIFRSVFLVFAIEAFAAPFWDQNFNRTWLEFLLLNKQNFCWPKQRPELRSKLSKLWSPSFWVGLSDCLPPLLKCSPEAVSDVGVVGVQVSREGTAQGHGQSHRPVRRVVDPGPGGEDRARHEDDPVEVGLSDHGAVHQVLHTGRPHALQHQLLVRIGKWKQERIYSFFKTCWRLFTILLSGNEHWNNLFYFVS